MTLIASYITKFGIVQASDSNLTSNIGNAGFGQKVFPISNLNASLAYSGGYTVNGVNVDSWMNDFIARSFFSVDSIEQFTIELRDRLMREFREEEIAHTIIHIAGYQTIDNRSHAEHWHISNTGLDPLTGQYSEASKQFNFSNDFNSRTRVEQRNILREINSDGYKHQMYINGFPPGRISSRAIKIALEDALNFIWEKNWGFRKPKNLFEFTQVVKTYFEIVRTLFSMSDYNAMYIGGEIQTHLTPVPQDLWTDE